MLGRDHSLVRAFPYRAEEQENTLSRDHMSVEGGSSGVLDPGNSADDNDRRE